jgi:hypothetical protein
MKKAMLVAMWALFAGIASASTAGTLGFTPFGTTLINTGQIGSATEVWFPSLACLSQLTGFATDKSF